MSDVVGIQAVRSALRSAPELARCLYVQKGRRGARMNELIGMARDADVRFQTVESAWFKRRVIDGEAHQGVVLEQRAVELPSEEDLFGALEHWTSPKTILVLDGVTDPRNLGACLRTANGAGAQAVVVPKRKSATLNAAALKTAQGGQDGVMVVEVTNLARFLKRLKDANVWLIGTDGEAAEPHYLTDLKGDVAIVMGAEGTGLRRLTRELCDYVVHIPMAGSVESLNVSVATGVVLYERLRQLSEASKSGVD